MYFWDFPYGVFDVCICVCLWVILPPNSVNPESGKQVCPLLCCLCSFWSRPCRIRPLRTSTRSTPTRWWWPSTRPVASTSPPEVPVHPHTWLLAALVWPAARPESWAWGGWGGGRGRQVQEGGDGRWADMGSVSHREPPFQSCSWQCPAGSNSEVSGMLTSH